MKQVMKAGAWALAVSMVFGAGCADKAEIVRPDQQNIGAALGDSKQCTPELLKDPNGAQRFVVEWNDGDREALESEMAQGVALVKYTCDGIKVLRSCAVPGDYGYRASSRKTKSLQITDAASASANLSSPTPSASFRAAMEQGKALNLAYVMIGSMTTTVKDVTRDQLDRAACKEATHFVYQTQVGAFAIAAGERGKAMAAAEVLKYGGASAEMSSERQALSSDGDAEACQAAGAKDTEPPDECRAMMRVSIIPLVEGKVDATIVASGEDKGKVAAPDAVDTRSCPAGLVFDGDICVKPAQAETFMCKAGDLAGCEAQCKKGSAESCGRMADAFFKRHGINYYYASEEFGPEQMSALRAAQGITPLMQRSCDDDAEANACVMAALLIGVQSGKTSEPDNAGEVKRMLDLMGTGCEMGSSLACGFVIAAYGQASFEPLGVPADGDVLEEIVAEGCSSGAVDACMSLAEFFYEGSVFAMGDSQVAADPNRAAKYLSKACYGGVSDACFWGAAMYATSDVAACASLVKQAVAADTAEVESYISLVWPILSGAGSDKSISGFCQKAAALSNPKKAHELADKACHLSGGSLTKNACAMAGALKR